MTRPPRYSDRPLPPYAFRPGRDPHPTRDPAGHSHERADAAPPAFDPASWSASETYLHGVDLFNARYWWEAHEAFEALWIALGRSSAEGLFMQGLIQVAAGLLKLELGQHAGARRLCGDGLQKLARPGERVHLGIDVGALARDVRAALAGESPAPPRIVLRFDRGPGG